MLHIHSSQRPQINCSTNLIVFLIIYQNTSMPSLPWLITWIQVWFALGERVEFCKISPMRMASKLKALGCMNAVCHIIIPEGFTNAVGTYVRVSEL